MAAIVLETNGTISVIPKSGADAMEALLDVAMLHR